MIAREHEIPFHTDAAQSVGKIPSRVGELGVDLLTVAGHKLFAPKGIGARYIRKGIELESMMHGAGHENGRRAGTESALFAAALGQACVLARDLASASQVAALRGCFWTALRDRLGAKVFLNGHPESRMLNTLNVSFVGHIGTEILAAIPEIAASTGSACHVGCIELSTVLDAMGVLPEVGMGAVRFSLGRYTTEEEDDEAVRALTRGAGGSRSRCGQMTNDAREGKLLRRFAAVDWTIAEHTLPGSMRPVE